MILREKRRTLMGRSPEKAVEAILNAERPVELVHSFPEEDLYLLVNEVGHQDALPILALASARQWEYMLDMDVWKGDTVEPLATTKWFSVLMTADPDRFARWCSREKKVFTELFLQRNIDVATREEDQDPADLGKDFITIDDVFYFRVKNLPAEYAPGPGAESDTEVESEADAAYERLKEQRDTFFPELLQRIATHDVQLYRDLLLEAASVIPAETEEALYRMRNVRLAEKGFLPLEEAVGVYQPIDPQDLRGRPVKYIERGGEPLLSAPLSVGALLEKDGPFSKALAEIDRSRVAMQLQSEIAGLCNSIIVADGKTIHTREELGEIVKKACGYINVGLESLEDNHRQLIQTYPLADIFRVGFGRALALKWKADAWQRVSWYARAGLPLHFWGETLMGVVGGLLIKKPLFFDNYATGTVYREFQTCEDIRRTEEMLDRTISFDKLFSRLSLEKISGHAGSLLNYKNLLLTLWTAHSQGLKEYPAVISTVPLDVFKTFFEQLWDMTSNPPTIKPARKNDFMGWISSASGLSRDTLAQELGSAFEELFQEIEENYARVSAKNIDPRFMQLFRVAAP